MNIVILTARNAGRNFSRSFLTVIGVAVAIVAFVLLRTVLSAWTVAAEHAAKDRIATRHKVTFVMSLPKKYGEQIRQIPGVVASTWGNWFGGKLPGREQDFFATMAFDAKSLLQVYDEVVVPKDQQEAFLSTKTGALIGDALAAKFGWKVGDKVTLTGTIYPGDYEFVISGIYQATRKSIDRSSFFFHWDYLNDKLPEARRDQIGWVATRVDDPAKTAAISAVIDKAFEDQDIQTLSMSEKAFQNSFLGMMSGVLTAIDIVSFVILAIMALILGNTIAMGVRERASEYAVLRAIGFLPTQLMRLVFLEAAFIGILGGTLGLMAAYPFIDLGLGRFIEENMGGFFPYFRVPTDVAIAALGLSVFLAVGASLLPAYQTMNIKVVDALRRLG